MTTPTTPYDAECTKHINDPRPLPKRPHQAQIDYAVAWGRREGYLRAIADMQPRHDALVAAAWDALPDVEGYARTHSAGLISTQSIQHRANRLQAALKAAEEEA